MRFILALGAVFTASGLATAADPTFPSSAGSLSVQTVASGLVHPWSLAFLPDGRMLVTERPGRMRIVTRTGQMSAALGNVPSVYAQSQAGLMDVLLARDFDSTHTIFVCYAEPADGGGRIAVLRARLIEGETPRLDAASVIFRQKGPVSRGLNIGCRMAQAPDGNLFVTLGDHFAPKELAQKLDNHIGKIVRITTRRHGAGGQSLHRQTGRPTRNLGLWPAQCAKGSPSTPLTENYGSRSTAPWAATRSISSRRVATTAGRA